MRIADILVALVVIPTVFYVVYGVVYLLWLRRLSLERRKVILTSGALLLFPSMVTAVLAHYVLLYVLTWIHGGH